MTVKEYRELIEFTARSYALGFASIEVTLSRLQAIDEDNPETAKQSRRELPKETKQ